MPELTEKEFKRHLNTKFLVKVEDQPIELELVEVKPYRGNNPEETGMERFSAFFTGPPEVHLPQRIYSLEHSEMGENDIFLVPVNSRGHGNRYEAVFNFFINKDKSNERNEE